MCLSIYCNGSEQWPASSFLKNDVIFLTCSGVYSRVWLKTNRNSMYYLIKFLSVGLLCSIAFMRLYYHSRSLWLTQKNTQVSRLMKTCFCCNEKYISTQKNTRTKMGWYDNETSPKSRIWHSQIPVWPAYDLLLCLPKWKTHWHLSCTVISSWMHLKLNVNVYTLCLKQSVNDSSLVNDMLVCLKPSVTNWVIPVTLRQKNWGRYWLGEG